MDEDDDGTYGTYARPPPIGMQHSHPSPHGAPYHYGSSGQQPQFQPYHQVSSSQESQFQPYHQVSSSQESQFPPHHQVSSTQQPQFPPHHQISSTQQPQFPSYHQVSSTPQPQFPPPHPVSSTPQPQFPPPHPVSSTPQPQFPSHHQVSSSQQSQFPPHHQVSSTQQPQFPPPHLVSSTPQPQFPSYHQVSSTPQPQFPPPHPVSSTQQPQFPPPHQVSSTQYQTHHPAPQSSSYHQVPPDEHGRQAPGNQQGEAFGQHHATNRAPQPTTWNSEPSPFAPSFGELPPQLGVEQDWHASILVGPPPGRVLDPPLVTLPATGTDEEADRFRKTCMHLGCFPDAVKRVLVDRWEPKTHTDDLVILNFTVGACGYPDWARPTIKLVSELIIRMLGRFREWATDEGLSPESLGSLAPEVWAKRTKATALYRLSQTRRNDPKTRWLFSLLRAIGDIPETWGLKDVPRHPEASENSNPHHAPATQGVPLTPQYTMSAAPRTPGQTTSDGNFNVMTGPFHTDQPPFYHSTPNAGASRAWSQGSPGLPMGDRSSAPGTSLYQQPTHPATIAHPSPMTVSGGAPSSATVAPAPPPRNVYLGGSVSHPTTGPIPSPGTPNESPRPVQAMSPPSFEAILQYERLRLLQAQNLGDRAKYLMELFYRSTYTETGSFFANSRPSSSYALALKDVPEHMDKFVVYMHKRFQYELALVSKVM